MSGAEHDRPGEGSGSAKQAGPGRVRAFLGTELGRVIPLMRRSPATWVGAMDQAGLPPEVDRAIREIVRRTRLWGGEKLDVARELIAHAKDGLGRGVAPETLAGAMGDPGHVARLIRRAMRRKRHWLWHARVWALRGLVGVTGVVLLVVGVMTARFFVGDPSPKRNFIAEMNAPFIGYGDDERSWPGLRDVNVAVRTAEDEVADELQRRANERAESGAMTAEERSLEFDQPGLSIRQTIDARHPDYEAVLGVLRELGPTLERSRELASRPIVGMLYSTKWPSDTDWEAMPQGWIDDPLPDSDVVAEQDLVIGVLLPWLGPIRNQCRWLALDARVAADEGDADRAVADVEAILGYAEQIDRDQILISNLVSLACTDLARVTLGRVMQHHPGLLGRDQLVALAHRFGRVRGLYEEFPLTWEINMFEDVLQRAYTDDGNGDGHLTNEGVGVLTMMEALTSDSGGSVRDVIDVADTVLLSSRARQRRLYMHAVALLRQDESMGYEMFRGRAMELKRWAEERHQDSGFEPVTAIMPSFSRAVSSLGVGRARIDGTLVSIAATLYKMDTGEWPAGVSELVPRYLPALAEDPFTGGPMLLAEDGDGGLIVYCVGRDGDDDGGTMDRAREDEFRPKADGRDSRAVRYDEQQKSKGWHTGFADDPFVPAADGDWVLFPPE